MSRATPLIAVLLLLGTACRNAETPSTVEPGKVPVETAVVASEDVDVAVEAVGTLQADQVVDLKPKRSAHVREVRLIEGGRVQKGDVLVLLDDDDLRARVNLARASVTEAEVRERNARRQYERSSALRKEGVVSEQAYDDAKAELDQAVARRGVAHASLALAEAELAETVIRAPFAGVLGRRRVDVGAFVKDGEPLATLVDPDPLEIVFAVPERHLGQLSMEQPVRVQVVSYADRDFPGTVSFIDPQVDPINRTATLKAVIANPDWILRPGQFATVRLYLDRHAGVPVVPEESVVPSGDQTLVFVVEDGAAQARPVRTGVRLPGRVEVTAGLRVGERVVRTGHEKLRADVALPVVDVGARAEG